MAKRGSPEWRANVSRQRRKTAEIDRMAARVGMRDLGRLKRTGTVSRALKPLAEIAQLEAVELGEALGGVESLSPQRRMLIEDVAHLGMLARAAVAMALQGEDGLDAELASRASTLMGARRQTLLALGLDRFEREVDLASYLAERARGPQEPAINVSSDPAPTVGDECPSEGEGENQ